MLLAGLGLDEQGGNEVVVGPSVSSACRPVLGGQFPLGDIVPFDGLHHLADHTVSQHHHWIAVAVGQVKCLLCQIHSLLDVTGSQNDGAVVAIPAATGGLVVVGLGGLDGPQAGAAPHHVDDHGGSSAPAR